MGFLSHPSLILFGMEGWGETRTIDQQIDSWQTELISCEEEITRIRARQVTLIRQLDRYQVDCGDGARTMGDWTSARLDLSRQTSTRLTQLAHANDPQIDQAMVEGKWGLDRAAALVKLRQAGLPDSEFSRRRRELFVRTALWLVGSDAPCQPRPTSKTFSSTGIW